MKIYQLLDNLSVPVTNEENDFIRRYNTKIRLTSLDERDTLLAHNLVRKGVYAISNDSTTLVKKINETNS